MVSFLLMFCLYIFIFLFCQEVKKTNHAFYPPPYPQRRRSGLERWSASGSLGFRIKVLGHILVCCSWNYEYWYFISCGFKTVLGAYSCLMDISKNYDVEARCAVLTNIRFLIKITTNLQTAISVSTLFRYLFSHVTILLTKNYRMPLNFQYSTLNQSRD